MCIRDSGVPIWKLLLDLSPAEITRLIDFSYLEEVLTVAEAVELLQSHQSTRAEREGVLKTGYPGYDTSVGWFQYSDEKIRDNAKAAVDAGFTAMKLKVGAKDHAHDVRRSFMVREAVGDDVRIMLDANQAWPLPPATTGRWTRSRWCGSARRSRGRTRRAASRRSSPQSRS